MTAGMPAADMLVLALGGLMVMAGLAFKLSAVPFHFWCPDVFEGATAEVNAFLSVASKAAALALLVRVAVGLGTVPPPSYSLEDLAANKPTQNVKYFDPGVRSILAERESDEGENETAQSGTSGRSAPPVLMSVADDEPGKATAAASKANSDRLSWSEANASLDAPREFMAKFIAVLAIVTCTFGNLAAFGQTNIKRLMAYSTIAHAGYMMMPVPVILAVVGQHPDIAQRAVAGLCIYIFFYLFMNLGAFVIVAFLRNAMRSEEIKDYAGLLRRNPLTVVAFSLILFSLIGMPPLAGFIGKFAIFAPLAGGYWASGKFYLFVLLLAAGINTVISLFYYLRVVKVMTMEPEPEDRQPFVFSDVSGQGGFIWALTLPIVVFILYWDGISNWALAAARHLFS